MIHCPYQIRRCGAYVLAAFLCCAAMTPASFAADAAPKQEIGRVIAKEITAAQKAMQAGQWADALKSLEAAEAKSPLTTFEKRTIFEFKGLCYYKLNNTKAAQTEYEQAVATGGYSGEELSKQYKTLFSLAATNQQYTKALEYGKQLSDSGLAGSNDLLIISQIYYQQKDCKDSISWGEKAIAAYRKAGEAPKEVLYQIRLQCASDASDTPTEIAALFDLIKLTNKTTYWNDVIRLERQAERDDKNTLMIYRVMYDTNSMTADSDYIEMAQLLGDQALSGEAATVLEKAFAANLVTAEHKERTTRLLASLRTRADADKKGLPQEDADSTKNPAGQLDVKTGEVYFGTGDYQNAVTAINRGIQKGQVKSLDEAYVYLGRSQVALKNTAEAKKAFGQLKTIPNISPRVLQLWEVYSEKLGS